MAVDSAGMGIWSGMGIDGAYFPLMNEVMARIAPVEEIYGHGSFVDNQVRCYPKYLRFVVR